MPALQTEPSPELETSEQALQATDETDRLSGCLLAAIVVLLPASLYFGVFGLLLVDSFVLRTKWFSSEHLSQEVVYGLEIVYAPLIYAVRATTGG